MDTKAPALYEQEWWEKRKVAYLGVHYIVARSVTGKVYMYY